MKVRIKKIKNTRGKFPHQLLTGKEPNSTLSSPQPNPQPTISSAALTIDVCFFLFFYNRNIKRYES